MRETEAKKTQKGASQRRREKPGRKVISWNSTAHIHMHMPMNFIHVVSARASVCLNVLVCVWVFVRFCLYMSVLVWIYLRMFVRTPVRALVRIKNADRSKRGQAKDGCPISQGWEPNDPLTRPPCPGMNALSFVPRSRPGRENAPPLPYPPSPYPSALPP